MFIQKVTKNRLMTDQRFFGQKPASIFIVGLVLLLFTTLLPNKAHAQEGFKVDWGLGYAFGGSSSSSSSDSGSGIEIETKNTGRAGICFYLEPRYGISEKITLGFRFGGDILGEGNLEINGEELTAFGADISGINSYLATGEYAFSATKVRAVAGLGLGLYTGDSLLKESDSSFGIMPRVGANFGHFRTLLSYNLAFKKEVPNYLSFTLGFEFGGGVN